MGTSEAAAICNGGQKGCLGLCDVEGAWVALGALCRGRRGKLREKQWGETRGGTEKQSTRKSAALVFVPPKPAFSVVSFLASSTFPDMS